MKTLITLMLMTAALPAFGESTFDRKLTKSEMEKMLPRYVAMVEKQAAELPSASENQAYVGLAGNVLDPFYAAFGDNNNIIGNQSHTAATILEGIQIAVAELTAVTPAQRVEEANGLMAGFKGTDKEAGRITCRLGYFRGHKSATNRIVKCEDNRSQSGSGYGDDEGYYDMRRVILSIDAKTLAPVSTLKLDHFIAG